MVVPHPKWCISKFSGGDDTILQQIDSTYTDHADALYRFCYTRTLCTEDAHDLVQDSFMNVYEYLKQGNVIRNAKVFLFQVANNLIIDRARAEKRRRSQEVSLEFLEHAGLELKGDDEVFRSIHRKMEAHKIIRIVKSRCSAEDYNLFVLRYMTGMMPADIATISGLSANCVSVRLSRVLKEVSAEASDIRRGGTS